MSKKRGLIVLSTLVVALISTVLLAPQAEAAKNLKLRQKVESALIYANLTHRGEDTGTGGRDGATGADWSCINDLSGARYRDTSSTDANWPPSNGDNAENQNTFVGKKAANGIQNFKGVDPITTTAASDRSCAGLMKAGIDIWEGSSKYADFYRHMGGKFFTQSSKNQAGWLFRGVRYSGDKDDIADSCTSYPHESWGRFSAAVNNLDGITGKYIKNYRVGPDSWAADSVPYACVPSKGGKTIRDALDNGIKNATGSLPSITSGSAEHWYMHSTIFTGGCDAKREGSLKEVPGANPDSSGYYYYKIPFTSKDGKNGDIIYKTSGGNKTFWVIQPGDSTGKMTKVACKDIGSWLQTNKAAFDKFAKYASEHKDEHKDLAIGDSPEKSADSSAQSTEDAGEQKEEKTCTSQLTGIGWFLCPVLSIATGLADSAWGMLEWYLVTSPLQSSGNTYDGWKTMRDLANVLLALVFILIIISQVSNVGISNYGIKKMLPRFIIAAIAVNISYFAIQVTVDIANILGSTLLSIITEPIHTVKLEDIGWGQLLQDLVVGGTVTAATIAGATIATAVFGPGAMIMFLFVALVPGLIGIVAGLVALVFRSALIPVLAILAPLAFAAWVLPNTQSIFDKWKKVFTGMVFLYPLAAIYYGGLKLLSFTILGAGNESNPSQRLMALFLLFAGSFVILGMALKSNAIIGNIMGRASGLLNKASAPALNAGNKFAKRKASMKRSEFMARDFSDNRFRRKLQGGLKGLKRRSLDRETRAALAEQNEQQRYRSELAEASAGELDKRLGFTVATTGGQAYIHKLSEEAAATRYKFEFKDDHVRALREGDEHVQALAAEKLSQSAWGAGELRKYLEDGGKITSHKMGDNMAAAKKYDAGVAKVGLAAADAIRGGQKDYGVTENQLAEVTSKAVGGLSTDTLATQNAKALVDAISQGGLSRDKASKVANNARNLSQASADSADIFEAVSKGDGAQLTSVLGKLVGQSNQKSAATPSVPPLQQNQAPQGVAQPTPSQTPSMAPDRQYAIKEQARGAEAPKPDSLSSSSGGQTQAPAPQVNVTVQVDRSSDPTSATSIPPSYIDQGGTSGTGRSQHRRNRPPTAFGR